MRGGMQYDDVYEMTPTERQIAVKFITDRLEHEMKKPNPIY